MGKVLEFEFDGGGALRLELADCGELAIRLQATHPGEGLKVTSLSVAIDPEKVAEIRAWLAKEGTE
jgi:hypothetical protein